MAKYTYTDDMVARMKEVTAGGVTEEVIESLMAEFDFPRRSVTAKLRTLEIEVPSKVEAPKFSAEETEAFKAFLSANSGQLTPAEVAAQFMDGKFTDRQVTGKALALERTGDLKKTTKVAKPKTYTEAEEAQITDLASKGAYLEDIAAALGKSLNSVRGKCLSMELKVPQRDKKVQSKDGTYPQLAELAPTMTVEELVEHYNKNNTGTPKTPRGIKTALARRAIQGKDYPVVKKAA